MKPGFADICAIIWSLAMVVVLALDFVALRSRGHVQWSGRGAGVKSAKRRAHCCFASTEGAYAAVYHRMGDCHATPISLRAGRIFERSPWRLAAWPFKGRRSGPKA
jgi:hypothetical protein